MYYMMWFSSSSVSPDSDDASLLISQALSPCHLLLSIVGNSASVTVSCLIDVEPPISDCSEDTNCREFLVTVTVVKVVLSRPHFWPHSLPSLDVPLLFTCFVTRSGALCLACQSSHPLTVSLQNRPVSVPGWVGGRRPRT